MANKIPATKRWRAGKIQITGIALAVLFAFSGICYADDFTQKREQMVREQIIDRGITDKNVIKAMTVVQRHLYVPAEYAKFAYADSPLPIGEGQTISQPYIVALMTELLGLKPGDKVLEVGTGSGYQASILAEITKDVYSIEIIPILAIKARKTLDTLGYLSVKTKAGDGYFGWQEFAPYDAIIVTAASDNIPQPLLQQLRNGGRMVIPVGPPGTVQTLWLIVKKDDTLQMNNVTLVQFVPLVRK